MAMTVSSASHGPCLARPLPARYIVKSRPSSTRIAEWPVPSGRVQSTGGPVSAHLSASPVASTMKLRLGRPTAATHRGGGALPSWAKPLDPLRTEGCWRAVDQLRADEPRASRISYAYAARRTRGCLKRRVSVELGRAATVCYSECQWFMPEDGDGMAAEVTSVRMPIEARRRHRVRHAAAPPPHQVRVTALLFAILCFFALAPTCPSPVESVAQHRLPTVIVTAQKEAADVKEVPASVTAVTADDHRRLRPARDHRRGDLRAQHRVHRVHRAQGQQRALPRHRIEPGQPGDHHLSRRRAAAQQQLVEHRAARRQPDRIRARPAEPAVRPQHARRHRQRDDGAAVDVGVDRLGDRAVRQRGLVGSARQRLGTARRQGGDRFCRRQAAA